MKFKEGKILERFHLDRNGKHYNVEFRYPRMSDAKQLLNYINALVAEDTMILADKKMTLKGEKEWLKDIISKTKKDRMIVVITEIDGSIAGITELKRHVGREYHVATFGISVAKKYRRL